jgi:hypothetical protein
MQAAEIAVETRRMPGRKPKAPQYYEFNADADGYRQFVSSSKTA